MNGLTFVPQKKDESVIVVIAAIGGNLLVTLAKFAGWIFSASPSMLAEAIHSAADTANQGLLYVGIKHGQGGPSRKFPWGQASSRYLWNLISAVGIFFVGFGVTTYHGVRSLMNPNHVDPSESLVIPVSILIVSFLVEGYVLTIAYGRMRKVQGKDSLFEFLFYGDNPTTAAVFLEDTIAVLGVGVALIGILLSRSFGSEIPDSIASIIIAVLLGISAIALAFINGRLLIGMAASEAKEDDIRDFLETYPSVEKVMNLKTQILGPNRIKLTADIELHGGILLHRKQVESDAERIRSGEEPLPILVSTIERTVRIVGNEINNLEMELQRKFPEIVSISLEVN